MNHVDPLTLGDEEFLARARSTCAHKAAYTSRAEARTFLRNNGFNGTVYKCPFCDHYHHTTYDRCRAKQFNKRLRQLLCK